jgi:adenylate cyclase
MRKYTLKVAISTLVSALILMSLIAISVSFYYGTKQALYLTTDEMMGQITRSMSEKLIHRLEGAERINALIADLILSGKIELGNEERFTDFLKDCLASNPSITSIDCGLPSGHKYQARRMPDDSISKRIVHRTTHEVITTWHHQNKIYEASEKDSVMNLETGYDPRVRPWWKAGIENREMVWTDIYPTGTGMNDSCVNPVYDAKGNLLCILAIDLNIGDLSVFLNDLKIGRTGKAFIIDEDHRVIAMSLPSESQLGEIMNTHPERGMTAYSLRDLSQIRDANIREAVLHYRVNPRAEGRGFLTFQDASKRRILASFEPEPTYKFTFGVVVPEDEILGPINRVMNLTVAMAGLFLVLALIIAYGISRAISKPLATLAQDVDRIRMLDLDTETSITTSIEEVVRIDQSIRDMKKGLRSFKKYVPSELVRQLMLLQKEAVIEGERKVLTLFFSDIANFTNISEKLPPEKLVEMMGLYFEGVTRILMAHSGTVDKFIGDAVMAFWNAPNPVPEHAVAACSAALRAQACIEDLNTRWEAEGGEAFHTRIGIHTGEATVGNIGFDERMNYTAIGDHVNLASRLEGLNKYYGTRILISEATLQSAGEAILARKVDLVTVKGKQRAIGIFELLAMRHEASAEQIASAERFNEAFAYYEQRRWTEAQALLTGPLSDLPTSTLLERCRHYLVHPPAADWNGVFEHHEK